MKKLLATSIILAAALTSNASAVDRSFPYWYLGLSGGPALQQDSDVSDSSHDIKWDTGYSVSASIGYQPPALQGFRVEAEIAQHKQDISNGSGAGRADTLAGNLYYDFYNSSKFTPYIGGGLGYGRFNLSNTNPLGNNGTNSRALYQGMAGIGYDPDSIPNVGFTLGYRYMAPFSDPHIQGSDFEYSNHSVELGAKFRF